MTVASPLSKTFHTAHATAQRIHAAYQRIAHHPVQQVVTPLANDQVLYGRIATDLLDRQMHDQYELTNSVLGFEQFKRTTLRHMANRSPEQPMREPGSPRDYTPAWFGADELLLHGIADCDDSRLHDVNSSETTTAPTLIVCWLALHDALISLISILHTAYAQCDPPMSLAVWQTAMRIHLLHATGEAAADIPHHDATPWAWQAPIFVERLSTAFMDTAPLYDLLHALSRYEDATT